MLWASTLSRYLGLVMAEHWSQEAWTGRRPQAMGHHASRNPRRN